MARSLSLVAILSLLLALSREANSIDVNVCDEKSTPGNWFIYCSGRILEAVNYHQLYNDSKEFVDMPMKAKPQDVKSAFDQKFGTLDIADIQKEDLLHFINDKFSPAGNELLNCTPSDWEERPRRLAAISDPLLRDWAMDLNAIWRRLCRKMHPDFETERDRHSLILVPNAFIAPGGRFREFYYWDTYWIIKGLIASGMTKTARDMIDNLGHVISMYGFIPNGGRIYYLQRSQPPFFAAMAFEYYQATRDKQFIRQIIPLIEKEQLFWHTQRSVNLTTGSGGVFEFFQYRTASNVPRPESFRADMKSAEGVPAEERPAFFQNVASAAETGWDFSTRWFSDGSSFHKMATTDVVPIDLNSLQCWNLRILAYLNEEIGKHDEAASYQAKVDSFQAALAQVFYSEDEGGWFDLNVKSGKLNRRFFVSNAAPLFTGCYDRIDNTKSERIFKDMKAAGAFNFSSGVPVSMVASGQQWDFPNGFAPLNHMLIEGLRKSENPDMQKQAFQLAEKWIFGNFKVFRDTKLMWEKYDVIGKEASPGSGGEYNVQDGFGWSNGAILDLLVTYGDVLRVPDELRGGGATLFSLLSSFPTLLFLLLNLN